VEPIVDDAGNLTAAQKGRYARHLSLPQVGETGQRRLLNSRVLCVGAGGLGSPVALYLAAAGVGTLDVIDDDGVNESNLQRQIIHTTEAIGRNKSASAASALQALNPHIAVGAISRRLDADNAVELVSRYDLVIDGTDTFATRYLINDACVLAGTAYVFASVLRFQGYAMVVLPGQSACYRCAFPTPPPAGSQPTCEQAGVVGAMCGVLGSIQAVEAIKLITGAGAPLVDQLFRFDALTMGSDVLQIRRDPACAVCGVEPTITDMSVHSTAPSDACVPGVHADVTALQLRDLLQQRSAQQSAFALIDVREPFEVDICAIQGSTLVPQGHVPSSHVISSLNPSETVIVMCRSGVRSAAVCDYLRARGFSDVRNLAGGILGWIDHVDPSLTRY